MSDLTGEVAVVADDTTRYAAGSVLVRLENDKTSGQADKRGQRRAFVAALFLVDLHDDVLTFPEDIPDIRLVARLGFLDEVLAGDFFQRQEAVAVSAVIDERGFETGLDARNLAFIDIGFFAFASRCFDIEVVKALAIDHRHAQLFFLSCVD